MEVPSAAIGRTRNDPAEILIGESAKPFRWTEIGKSRHRERSTVAPVDSPGHRRDIRHSRTGPPDELSKKFDIPHDLRSIMRFARQKTGRSASHHNQYGFHLGKHLEIRCMGFPKQPKPITPAKGTGPRSADRWASMD
ncbi:hypothetical protein [Micromonospora sp. WMMD987]|uniref:hypothetical protein n=1 Tax=Micromonospora TaxID=1873 RepID=UPI00249AFA85|nr:hypothetical protein [Micromonospora sp. WMMD987]WFE96832.1 hypothetical protein O7612_08100 [Micromonospora sp. WMMD987]